MVGACGLVFILLFAQYIVGSHVERINVYPSNHKESIQLVEGKLQVESSFLVDSDVVLNEIEVQDFSLPAALEALEVMFVSPRANLGSTWKYLSSKFDYYASIAGTHVRVHLNTTPTTTELRQISAMLSYTYGLPMSTGSVENYANTTSDIFSKHFKVEKNMIAQQSLRHWAPLDEDFFALLSANTKVAINRNKAPIFRHISKLRELATMELVHGDGWQHGIVKHTFNFNPSSGKPQLRVRKIFRSECVNCEFDQLIWRTASYLRYIPNMDTLTGSQGPIAVSSRISGSGFHRAVELSNVGSVGACEFLTMQHLPRSAYIDLDEMRQLERLSDIKIRAFSRHIDVEKPASLSSEHVVFVAFGLHKHSQSFPIHFRYQDPAENSLDIAVSISSPVVWYRCSNDTPEWVLASQEIAKTIHNVSIPVGQSMARDLVGPATLLATVGGAVAIVLAAYYSKPVSPKSKFH